MARYKPSAETMKMFKEDLPDNIENIVDDVAENSEKVVDDLIDQYELDLNKKLDAYKKETDQLFAKFEKEVLVTVQQSEQVMDDMQAKIDSLKASTEELNSAISAQSNLNLDVSFINERTNELNNVITVQRQKIQQISTTASKYIGAMARTALPF